MSQRSSIWAIDLVKSSLCWSLLVENFLSRMGSRKVDCGSVSTYNRKNSTLATGRKPIGRLSLQVSASTLEDCHMYYSICVEHILVLHRKNYATC